MKLEKNMKKSAFTFIEMLAVIAILAILITLSSKGLRAARLGAKKTQAKVEMKAIETALSAYLSKYGKLPVAAETNERAGSSEVEIFTFEPDAESDQVSRKIIAALTADGGDPSANAAGIIFLESQSAHSNGGFVDPWGYQYRIALDTDYDGYVYVAGESVRRKYAIAAIGLYNLNEGADVADVIRSWQ